MTTQIQGAEKPRGPHKIPPPQPHPQRQTDGHARNGFGGREYSTDAAKAMVPTDLCTISHGRHLPQPTKQSAPSARCCKSSRTSRFGYDGFRPATRFARIPATRRSSPTPRRRVSVRRTWPTSLCAKHPALEMFKRSGDVSEANVGHQLSDAHAKYFTALMNTCSPSPTGPASPRVQRGCCVGSM